MRTGVGAIGLLLACAGCVSTQETVSIACTDVVGHPVSERIAALGPPTAVVRLSPTQVGYAFEATASRLAGGDVYYTTNYLVGVDAHRTPVYRTSTVCRGTYVVHAPSDGTPLSERIVVDVLR